jgi:hypothetical protein
VENGENYERFVATPKTNFLYLSPHIVEGARTDERVLTFLMEEEYSVVDEE